MADNTDAHSPDDVGRQLSSGEGCYPHHSWRACWMGCRCHQLSSEGTRAFRRGGNRFSGLL